MKKKLMSYDWYENIVGLQVIGMMILSTLGLIMVGDLLTPTEKFGLFFLVTIVMGVYIENQMSKEKKRRR